MRSAVSPPSDMPTTRRGVGAHSRSTGPQRLGVELRPVVAVLTPRGAAVPGQVDRQRGHAEAEDDGVPGVGVLAAAVQEDHLRGIGTPLDGADVAGVDALDGGQRARRTDLFGVLGQQGEFVAAHVRSRRV